VCWEVYRGACGVLETKRGVAALDWQQDTKYLWRPNLRPKLKDWAADFAFATEAALREPERVAHGYVPVVLPGIGRVRASAAFFGIERERLEQLVGRDS
jgi:hypothetical protein